eukprot:PhM_4_TR16431/c0_g1_i1/m.3731
MPYGPFVPVYRAFIDGVPEVERIRLKVQEILVRGRNTTSDYTKSCTLHGLKCFTNRWGYAVAPHLTAKEQKRLNQTLVEASERVRCGTHARTRAAPEGRHTLFGTCYDVVHML